MTFHKQYLEPVCIVCPLFWGQSPRNPSKQRSNLQSKTRVIRVPGTVTILNYIHAHVMYTTVAFDAIGEIYIYIYFFVDSFRFMIHA